MAVYELLSFQLEHVGGGRGSGSSGRGGSGTSAGGTGGGSSASNVAAVAANAAIAQQVCGKGQVAEVSTTGFKSK